MPRHVTLSIPKHVPEGLYKLQHPEPLKPQDLPAKHTMPTCRAKAPNADDKDDAQLVLPENEVEHAQRAVGTTSYHA